MTDTEQREAARQFYYKWNGKGKEDEDARSYWIDILHDIFGVDNVTDRVQFEKKVADEKSKKKIDVYIPETNVLIEHKSLGIALDKPQPGHDNKTPYQQAKEYDNLLPYAERARWIVTSNFAEIWIYDMSVMKPAPIKLTLADLQTKYHLLDFLLRKDVQKITTELRLSIQAGELVGKIHDRFLEQYHDPMAKKTQNSLNILCVRLVFCLYADDSGLFGERDAFRKYIEQYEPKDIRQALLNLFEVLNTPEDARADMYLSDDLERFPYVNGGLFERENIVIPKITDEIKNVLLEASLFDWSHISPVIFGAVFESTLNPETRRAGGMHYTSVENIHKVIDPLFLDDLKVEFEEIKNIAVWKTQEKKLLAFQDKLASLVFLDPAAGSGNFLTETYLCLRRLENQVINLLTHGQMTFGEISNPIKVSISQFYGIEINDFAVTVARTALWIAESQMFKETEYIVHMNMDFLPLKTNAYIVEGNALAIDWDHVVPRNHLSYIMGNPPFVGARIMSKEQKQDVLNIFGSKWKNVGNLDYVCCWYKKATDLIYGTDIKCALVSTNSVCQGETVADLWQPLFAQGVHIDYAYKTFIWDSEASIKAHVHCVIVGFSTTENTRPLALFETDSKTKEVIKTTPKHINAYLVDGDDVFIESREKPICNIPEIGIGNKLVDFGFYIYSREKMEDFLQAEPAAADYFKPWIGGNEFINLTSNDDGLYILWLGECPLSELRKMPKCMKVVENVRQARLKSKSPGTIKLADQPTRFHVENMPKGKYLVIPIVSSERRRYIPIGYLDENTLCSQKLMLMPHAELYHFGILMSNVHMAWTRTVCGRLKSDYSYSKNIVYNNFPWPVPTEDQKQAIVQAAQAILNARALYPDSSLADLYDPLTMPPELRKAHQKNDIAVMQAYGMPVKTTTEADCVAWLMRLYQQKIAELNEK